MGTDCRRPIGRRRVVAVPKRKADFPEETRIKALLWCDRHCCLCKKACGVNIEVDHLVPVSKGGSNDLDNAMPLCYDCHAKIHQYDRMHPRGTKYRLEEVKARREQVYEQFTRHLVPPLDYRITQEGRTFPDVGFVLRHLGDSLPVRVRTKFDIRLDGQSLGSLPGHYAGEKLWRLNPRMAHFGHFLVPEIAASSEKRLEVEVAVTIIDIYDGGHQLLPVGWVYKRDDKSWYFEP